MNKLLGSLVVAGLLTTGMAQANSLSSKEKTNSNANDEYSITKRDIAASPELAEESLMRSSSTSMRCLVDTPRWDQWGSPYCMSVGFARNATAFFQIQNPPANYQIIWSDSRCNSGSVSCALPIRTYQQISLSATVLNTTNNTYVTVQASAQYEGMD